MTALFRRAERLAANFTASGRQQRGDCFDDAGKPHSIASILLATGGDGRIWPDPVTGRNRYGTRTSFAGDEISFSSTTASNVSRDGLLAASAALERFVGINTADPSALQGFFDDIRARIGSLVSVPGAPVVLTASGTDAELIAVSLITAIGQRPLTNIVMAPGETGAGVPLASAGRHFSDLTALGRRVAIGDPLSGIVSDDIRVLHIPLRDARGIPLPSATVDDNLLQAIEEELKAGRDILMHVLDASKTGLAGASRDAARHALELGRGRVFGLVDACQLRSTPARLQQDLADGFIVAVTGSKYLAGPPFCGALLLPEALAQSCTAGACPGGLHDYSTTHDWPTGLAGHYAFKPTASFNLGLGLRWIAALEQGAGFTLAEPLNRQIRQFFVDRVRDRAGPGVGQIHSDDEGAHVDSTAIVALTLAGPDNRPVSFQGLQAIHAAMRARVDGPVCHLGQPVLLGERAVLRVSASAADVKEVATVLSHGGGLAQAFPRIEASLDATFDKLSRVRHRLRDQE